MKARDFLKRFREPSTYAGIAGLALVLGVPESNPILQQFLQYGAAASAAAAVLLPEKGGS